MVEDKRSVPIACSGTAVVIGHGRSPEHRGWGHRIDHADVVYRLWDWEWQNVDDYGSRYDYGYYTAIRQYVELTIKHSKAKPARAWLGQHVVEKCHSHLVCYCMPGLPVSHLFTETKWLDIGRRLGGVGKGGRYILSRGCLTACWAAEHLAPGSTLVLVGYDNIRERRVLPLEEAFPPEFRANPGTISFENYPTKSGETKEGPHDFAVEGLIIKQVATQQNIKLVHAQDIWPPGTIAVIGHGKSPVGKGWGKKIDACDHVMRMWDCHWHDETDYGTKYDFGFFETHHLPYRMFRRGNKRTPSMSWVGSCWNREPPSGLPEGTELINPDEYAMLAKHMGGAGTGKRELTFTRGTMAALWAIEWAAPGDQIILVGFDNVVEGYCLPVAEGYPEVYLAEPTTYTFEGYAPGETKHGGHDFGIERALLERAAEYRKVELLFSQDVW